MPSQRSQNRKRIVLLGIGHTNAHVLKQWEHDPIPDCDLICVSQFPMATYSGMLPGTLGGQFSDEEMRIDLHRLANRCDAELVLAETTGLNRESQELLFADHDPIRYDALSIGVGSMPAGWQQHAGCASLVAIKPMQSFLQRLNGRLRAAASDNQKVAIVGGGVAGVEIAMCLQQFQQQNPNVNLMISLFTSGTEIAGGMTDRSVRRLNHLLRQRGIQIFTESRVTEIHDTCLTTENGERHHATAVIWATGAAATPVLGRLELETDARGFIATTSTLQSLSDPRIFAVGDAGTVIESPSPKAGVYAVRQCPILWHNLRSFVLGTQMRTFQPQNSFLKILNTGDGKALLEYGWITAHARWCLRLKNWIDHRFIREFQFH